MNPTNTDPSETCETLSLPENPPPTLPLGLWLSSQRKTESGDYSRTQGNHGARRHQAREDEDDE
jgi:hypothetical protein